MNILLASLNYKPHHGGIENSLFYMGKELTSLGHNVVIMSGDKTVSGLGRLPRYELIDGIHVYRFRRLQVNFAPFKLFVGLGDIVKSAFLARSIHQKYDFQLAVLRSSSVGVGVYFALKSAKKIYIPPAVAALLDKKAINQFEGSKISRVIKYYVYEKIMLKESLALEKLLTRVADRSYVFSENMKNQLSHFLGERQTGVKKINPGVDSAVFSFDIQDKISARQMCDVAEDLFVFLIIGRIIAVKGVHYALEAFARIDKKRAILMIVGDGPEVPDLVAQAKSLGIESKVRFIPSTTTPEIYYKVADAFIMSSTYEAFGQTILEAMSSGLPIVGFRSDNESVLTATDEIVKDGVNGFLCEFDTIQLGLCMEKIIDLSDGERMQMAQLNRKKTDREYNWRNFCQEIVSV